ncbi:MAG: hypothetical protein WD626_05075, partial [Bauldia sp.]
MTDRGGGRPTGVPANFPIRLDGYTDLPAGKIANIVTFLERTEPPAAPPPAHAEFAVRGVANP